MADSAQVRTRRSRAHSRGDHRHCLVSRCPYAGQVERDDVHDLRSAIEVEFAGGQPRLQTARRLVDLASGKGAPAVAALTQLDRMIESARSGRYVPVTGPITVTDEIRELAAKLTPDAERLRAATHEGGLAGRAEVEDVRRRSFRSGVEFGRRIERGEAHPEAVAEFARAVREKPELGELDGRGVR